MAVRIRFIYLLFIILISFGTIVGCHDPCACEGIRLFGVTCCPPPDSPCDLGEKLCVGVCIPFEVDCCFDLFNDEFVGPCTLSEPFCCDAGNCASDLASCPDVIDCPEHHPQPCGPFCILEGDACCNEGRIDIDPIFCPDFCCNDEGECRVKEECCGDPDHFCGFIPSNFPPPF